MFYLLYRQDSNNTEVSPTNLETIFDIAYAKAVEDIMPDNINARQLITVPHTTFASSSGATNLVVASGTSFTQDTDIAIWLGSRYDIVRCSNVSTNTFTLSSPGLLYYASYTTSAKVTPVSFVISDVKDIIGMQWIYNTTSKREAYTMHPARLSDKIEYSTIMKSSGVPSRYMFFTDTEMFIYPIPEAAGYIEITYKNNTTYTLSADGSSPSVLNADSHMALVYWALYMTAIRNKDYKDIELYFNLYNYTVEQSRKRIRKRKEDNHSWNLKISGLEKR